MHPSIALFLYVVLLLGLLRYDPAKESRAHWTLWVPSAWQIIVFSRLPAQWLGMTGASAAEALEEGNWLDRGVFAVLLLLAVAILAKRSLNWGALVASNSALALVLLFGFLSITWSDFPSVALRRWIRDLGLYLVALVILSDSRPLAAIDTVIRRVCYILVPLSVIVIKYYPGISVGYDAYTGAQFFKGVSTDKNGLGLLCVASGIFFFWDIVRRWPLRRKRSTKRTILVDVAFLGMTLWLLNLSQSATSRVCLVVGCFLIVVMHSRSINTRPLWLKMAIPTSVCLFFLFEYSVGITDLIYDVLGRNRTLTDRTAVWATVLPMNPSLLLGAGYESFWLGDRLEALWTLFRWQPKQAHNGYIEVYLNLGLLGLLLVGVFLLNGYRRIWRPTNPVEFASFSLAIWTIMLLYNVTEAAMFKGRLWVWLLLASVVVPRPTVGRVQLETRKRANDSVWR
jgi:exopolysaccharide production protein ExoQ